MATHPLWRPFDTAASARSQAARLARRPTRVDGVLPYDDAWVAQFAVIRDLLLARLGPSALAVRHVGSTSVPGLPAKPIIDVDLLVRDATDETSYRPVLEAAGFVLIAREPWWEEHRCFAFPDPNANVHVFSVGAVEPRRHLRFRQWLVDHDDDRGSYGELKLALQSIGFRTGGDYNGAKAAFIYDLYEKIFAADPEHPHDPRPRQA